MFYTLVNEKNNLLKYVSDNKFVFNCENGRARKNIVYKVKKKETAERLMDKAKSLGFECSVCELTDELLKTNLEKKNVPSTRRTMEIKNFIIEPLSKDDIHAFDDDSENVPTHRKCRACIRRCKQNSNATIYRCPLFEV